MSIEENCTNKLGTRHYTLLSQWKIAYGTAVYGVSFVGKFDTGIKSRRLIKPHCAAKAGHQSSPFLYFYGIPRSTWLCACPASHTTDISVIVLSNEFAYHWVDFYRVQYKLAFYLPFVFV